MKKFADSFKFHAYFNFSFQGYNLTSLHERASKVLLSEFKSIASSLQIVFKNKSIDIKPDIIVYKVLS